jgi:glycosyltransferase involved in cell wall biosynthesis
MRFLVIYNGAIDPNGGSSGTVWQTNAALRRLGHEVDVIDHEGIPRRISHHNLHYATELPRRILHAARARISRKPYDIVLISQPYGYLVGKWLRTQMDAPIYLHRSHGHELAVHRQLSQWGAAANSGHRPEWRQAASRLLSLRLRRQARLALRYADGTIVPSSFDRDFLVEMENVDPLRVRSIFHASIPSYLEAPPRPYTQERHRKLLYVGNFSEVKGSHILSKAGTLLLRRFPSISLTIVTGRGSHARVLGGFENDVRRQVTTLDWMPQDALMKVYDSHGLQVVPSLYEGAGKAHYEGMSRGLCLVCSSVGAMRDSLTDNENGRLIPPGDSEALLETLSRLITKFDVTERLAHNARRRSLDFSWDRNASEVVAYARDLLSIRAGAALAYA